MNYDLAIIGAGPAGMSAAIYASRGQLKTILFGDETKSNLYKSHIIANYFGVAGSPSGPQLAKIGLEQAISFGTEHLRNEIVDLSVNGDGSFNLKDNKQNLYQVKAVILATGQSYILSGIKGEQEYTGKGVSYCVTCDGFFFKDQSVVIVGSSDYAAEEAIQLYSYTKDISILSHGKKFTFSQKFQEELDSRKIRYFETPRLASIEGENFLEKVIFSQPLENGQKFLPTKGVFMAVGIAGANAFGKKLGLEMEGNYIKVDKNGCTNLKGLFAAGDCTGSPAQVASSVGNGCNASLSAIKLIRGLNNYIQYN